MAVNLYDYKPIVGTAVIDELRILARPFYKKTIKMVNSTRVGGGVAEILNRLIPLFNELEIDVKWEVIEGNEEFFDITKSFHNAIHGEKMNVTKGILDSFIETNRQNAAKMSFNEDIIVIHDPQPIIMIEKKSNNNSKWIWRCHIDTSHSQPEVWDFLKGYVEKYDASIFSSPNFSKSLSIPQFLVSPSIDPLSEKNRDLPEDAVHSVVAKYKLDPKRPIITQISRFDRLKDPLGVIDAYRKVKKYTDCQLVLAGGAASDDPEANQVLAEINEKVGNDKDIHVLNLPPFSDTDINALQRASTIILQKSLREGFGLTVTEGLWKGKPVIASNVGGIPSQIKHNLTGILVHSVDGCAYQIRYLLNNPDIAKRMGEYGKEYVREKFLLTRSLRNYLLLFTVMNNPGKSLIELK
ncbi:glycosyltransferase [Candidatus Margulisiibacteriota bacterium]